MSTKMKGLLKGLRYISQIFDEKEEEIQIGFPTDVKHVAHIGSDDPSANAPSWMTEFKGTSEPTTGTTKSAETLEGGSSKNRIPKSRHSSIDSESNTKSKRSSDGSKHGRRHRSSDPSSDSSGRDRDSSAHGSRHSRRNRGSNNGSETASQELPPPGTKKEHRRKSKKTSSEDGSVTKPSRTPRSSKGDSLTDISLSDFGSESGHGSR